VSALATSAEQALALAASVRSRFALPHLARILRGCETKSAYGFVLEPLTPFSASAT